MRAYTGISHIPHNLVSSDDSNTHPFPTCSIRDTSNTMDFQAENTINKRKVETGTEQLFKRRLIPLIGHVPSVREDEYSVPPTRNVSPASESLFCSKTLSPLELDYERVILEGIAEAMASMPLD